MITRYVSLATAAALAAVATQATAQQAPAAAAPPPNPTQQAFQALQAAPPGPIVAGLCVLSREGIIGRSTVGAYAARELERIEQTVNTELNTARSAAETNIRSLESQATAGTLPRESAGAQANQIAGNLQNLVNLRVAEIRETDTRVQARIMTEATPPLILESIRAKNCSALFDASALIFNGNAYDITSDVVTRLNGRVTSFPIERVQAAPGGAPAAAAAGPPPVATTPAPAGGRGGAAPGRGAAGPTR